MDSDILRVIVNAEPYIYIILGGFALYGFLRLFKAIGQLQGSMFGLEKEIARGKVREAASILLFLAFIASLEFVLVTFVQPIKPMKVVLPTQTLDLLATPTITLEGAASGLPTAATEPAGQTGCVAGQIEFTNPLPGAEVRNEVELRGTVLVPGFGFYKYEYAPAGSSNWITIAAGNQQVQDGLLGIWNTNQLTPGDYQIRLVVTDNQGTPLLPCVLSLRVIGE